MMMIGCLRPLLVQAGREGQEAEGAEGSRSFQMQVDVDHYSPHPMYDQGRSSSFDNEVMKSPGINSFDGHNHNSFQKESGGVTVDYMLSNTPINYGNVIPPYQQQQRPPGAEPNSSNMSAVERTLSFADVMQFAEFGPKLGLSSRQSSAHILHNQQDHQETSTGLDPVSFVKFPVLVDNQLTVPSGNNDDNNSDEGIGTGAAGTIEEMRGTEFSYEQYQQQQCVAGTNNAASQHYNNPVQLEFLGNATVNADTTEHKNLIDDIIGRGKVGPANMEGGGDGGGKSSSSKRKRPRTIKTSEEVESQRMTHIAVERNRRKQMNEHLRVLRSLMPSSYVQRGDQASIIGGAIEFVRELEQLLQCLESQKRRRLYGDQQARPMGDSSPSPLGLVQQPPPQPLGFPPSLPTLASGAAPNQDDPQLRLLVDDQLGPNNNHDDENCATGGGLLIQEETAESKSCIADVEVKVLGFDALIKILSRRRPSQLIKAIAALEDLQFTILHTNVTTIEQTVLYSFNVKVASEAQFTAEDIASSIQQIFTFIHANTNII